MRLIDRAALSAQGPAKTDLAKPGTGFVRPSACYGRASAGLYRAVVGRRQGVDSILKLSPEPA